MVNGTTTKSYMPMITLTVLTISKEAERDSHGMHVTGIATGNPDKEAGNGEKRSMVWHQKRKLCLCVSFRIVKKQLVLLFM